jgi:hypothetical protein
VALACAPLMWADGPPAKEKKRPPAKKVYTEEDLRRGGTVSVGVPAEEASPEPGASPAAEGSPAPGASPAAAGAEKKEPTEDERRQNLRGELQGKIDEEREKIRLYEARIAEIQSELNDLGGLTYGSPGGNDRRTGLMNEVEEARRQIKQAQEAIESLEAQARREGLPVTQP